LLGADLRLPLGGRHLQIQPASSRVTRSVSSAT
jgi:hypothetical protein